MARQKVTRKSRDMVHASGSRSSKVSSTSTPSRVDGPLPAENDVIDLTGLLSSDSDDSESDDGKARVKDKGKIKANEKARVKEEKDGNSVSSKVKLEPSGKRRVPAITIGQTKLKLKERKWKTYESSSMSFKPQAESSIYGMGKLKVMPRVKARPPSEIFKRTPTIDREQKAKARSSEVIDLTMELSEEEDDGEKEDPTFGGSPTSASSPKL